MTTGIMAGSWQESHHMPGSHREMNFLAGTLPGIPARIPLLVGILPGNEFIGGIYDPGEIWWEKILLRYRRESNSLVGSLRDSWWEKNIAVILPENEFLGGTPARTLASKDSETVTKYAILTF